ncbi:hypothetical protein HDF14_000451 [Edaphobacter lichenicola]|uniref:Uncharacterized protein n=1 Tax=Tunturiibacter gelidiferens TaxID=3069689 RepID=A0A9X0U3J4_9BACT|nr:hypothetical protein [Edaphobacter lichenicola]
MRRAFVQYCNRSSAGRLKQRTFHLWIFTMKGGNTVVHIYSYSSC